MIVKLLADHGIFFIFNLLELFVNTELIRTLLKNFYPKTLKQLFTMRMQLKELYNTARNELSDIIPVDDSDFRLEQAEYNEKGNFWEIVVSYLVKKSNKPINTLTSITSPQFNYDRIYKTVKINDSGEVAGFYIYNN